MTRSLLRTACSSLLRLRRSTPKSRAGAVVQQGPLLSSCLDSLLHDKTSSNGLQLLFYSSSSPAATTQPESDAVQPSWQGTLPEAGPHLPSRRRHAVPSELEKRDVQARALQQALETSIQLLADKLKVKYCKVRAMRAIQMRERWVAGQATLDDVEEVELKNDVQNSDHLRMFSKELANKASQDAKHAAHEATQAASRAGNNGSVEEMRYLLNRQQTTARIAAATEDYASLHQEAWELAKQAFRTSTERRLKLRSVTVPGRSTKSVKWKQAILCPICSRMGCVTSCEYLRDFDKNDLSVKTDVDVLFARKLKYEEGFRTALSYLKSKFVWHDTSTFSGFLPLHIRETFDAPLPAHEFLRNFDTQVHMMRTNLHLAKPSTGKLPPAPVYHEPKHRPAWHRWTLLRGSLPTEDLHGNPITVLWTISAPSSLDDPFIRDVIELVRQFVTRFNDGEKSKFGFSSPDSMKPVSIVQVIGTWHISRSINAKSCPPTLSIAVANRQMWQQGLMQYGIHLAARDGDLTKGLEWWSMGQVINGSFLREGLTSPERIKAVNGQRLLLATLRDIREPMVDVPVRDFETRDEAVVRQVGHYYSKMRRRAMDKYGRGSAQSRMLNFSIYKENEESVEAKLLGAEQAQSDSAAAPQPEGASSGGGDSTLAAPAWLPSWTDVINLGRERVPGDGKIRPAPHMAQFDTYLPQKAEQDQPTESFYPFCEIKTTPAGSPNLADPLQALESSQ